ncbi:unnamed protein product, partial [Rotaria sp. Silwood2]
RNSFNLQSTVLNFCLVNKEHKSNEISQLLQAKLKELNILNKVVRVTIDGAKNMIRAIDDIGLGSKRVWCIAHRLHLTIINAFGFWIEKKDDTDDNEILETQQFMYDTSNTQAEEESDEMINVDEFQSNTECNEINTDLTREGELLNDESLEESDSYEEELLSDIMDEQIVDNWIADINESENHAISDQDMIIPVIRKCRGLVLIIKSSIIITSFFDAEREKMNIKRNLCYDVKSRWNSTYCMIDAFLGLREVIEKLFNQKHSLHVHPKQIKKLTALEFKSDDWIILSALHTVLKPFFHATKVLSGRDYPSIGLAYYLLSRLKNFLQHHQEKKENIIIKRLKELLLSQFMYYFESNDGQVQLLKFHAYFDPAGYATLTDDEKRAVEQNIKKMINDDIGYLTELIIPTPSISLNVHKSTNKLTLPRKTQKNVIDVFNESLGEFDDGETQCNENKQTTIVDDIQNYRKCVSEFRLMHKIDASSSTLFWQTFAESFPILSKLAKKFLCTPATSVPSESCFSMSSYLARKERARLTGDNLSSSVFLKDKINF